MQKNHLTVAIYGIKDNNSSKTPTISHDHAVAIMQEGKLIQHIQLERYDRIKYSSQLHNEIYQLLKAKGIFVKNIDLVFVDNVLGRSFINTEGNIRFEGPIIDTLAANLEKGKCYWLDKTINAYVLNHELAHIGSCLPFYGAFKNNSLLVHFDGGASLSNFSAWAYKDNKIELIEADWKFKHLSALFNANALMFGILGAKQHELNSVPGKLMGFASYGNARTYLKDWLIKNNFFEDLWKSKGTFFKKAETDFGINIKHLSQKDSFVQDIVATTHQYFVDESLTRFKKLKEATGFSNLYYSGGSALSIVLNTHLIESGIFEQVYIPPCCNDSGLALGAAAFMEWQKENKIHRHSPYLNNWGIEDYKSTVNYETLQKVSELLLKNKAIGICNNAGEIGPRALGNRSIIALASSKSLAKKVSMEIKNREWYRPVAPIMLEKNAKYFTDLKVIHPLSEYMLLDFKIANNRQKELAGAMHIDKTARIQTLTTKDQNPFMYELLTILDKKHNIKALINTSFNAAGEPIVHTIQDALKSAKRMQLDAVVLNGELTILKA